MIGAASYFFLVALKLVSEFRSNHNYIIWGLPFAGAIIGYFYKNIAREVEGGGTLVMNQMFNPAKPLSLLTGPIILIVAVVTHLFGGSVGREGAAVETGASLADQLTSFIRLNIKERRHLLLAGAGAGFGTILGTPLAGAIFGIEVMDYKKIKFKSLFFVLLASLSSFYFANFLGAPYIIYPKLDIEAYELKLFIYVFIASLVFGGFARFYVILTRILKNFATKVFKDTSLKLFVGGLLLATLFFLEGSFLYAGIGIETIKMSLSEVLPFKVPVFKTLFTSLSIGFGFRGGEFIPLIFVGATLGSFLSSILPLKLALLSSLGFSAVVGAASKTPLACAILVAEAFGISLLPLSLLACYVSLFISGKRSFYERPNQDLNLCQEI